MLHDAKIVIQGLPSHASHELQPLDVCVFSAFKSRLRSEFEQALLACNEKKFDVFAIAEIVKRSYDTALTRSNIISGFSKTGLWCIKRKGVDSSVVKNITLTAPVSSSYKNLTHPMNLVSGVHELQPKHFRQTARMLDYRALIQSFRKNKRSLLTNGTVEEHGTVRIVSTHGVVLTNDSVLEALRAEDIRKQKKTDLKVAAQ